MTPWLDDADVRLYHGDALEQLAGMPDGSVQCIVTSPPFWNLRDYGVDGQIGLEATPDEWCDRLVDVFHECRRVLRDDGVLWLEVGDTYASKARGSDQGWETSRLTNPGGQQKAQAASMRTTGERHRGKNAGLKEKDLVGAPWMLAFALRGDGWYLRSENIWERSNPMPESVTDRPTKAHSQVFLLAKSTRYFYDAAAIRTLSKGDHARNVQSPPYAVPGQPPQAMKRRTVRPGVDTKAGGQGTGTMTYPTASANARSVWRIPTEPTSFAHFATMPQALAEKCIRAGSREGDTVLDPFMGSGTTALVARRLARCAVGIELNAEYLAIASRRLQQLSLLGGTA